MNTILGGMFQSRLNANIREEKGYSYGVSSGFGYGKGPGPFRTGGDIVTEKSDAALVEFMKELQRHPRQPADHRRGAERAKDALVQRLPATFASVSSINSALTTLWTQDLPDDYYQQYAKTDRGDHQGRRAARGEAVRHLDHLAIVIVGDQVGDRRAAEGGQHRADRLLRHRGESGGDEVGTAVDRARVGSRSQTPPPREEPAKPVPPARFDRYRRLTRRHANPRPSSRTSASPPAGPAAGRRRRCAGTRRS